MPVNCNLMHQTGFQQGNWPASAGLSHLNLRDCAEHQNVQRRAEKSMRKAISFDFRSEIGALRCRCNHSELQMRLPCLPASYTLPMGTGFI